MHALPADSRPHLQPRLILTTHAWNPRPPRWELYTGGVAFSNLTGTPIKLLQTVIADGVRPPWPDGVPGWYMSMASRCWAGNPKQRPSFRRIVDKLQEVASAQALASSAAAAGWVGVSSFHA